MMSLLMSLTLLVWIAAGFAFILGARRFGAKLARVAFSGMFILGVGIYVQQCHPCLRVDAILVLVLLLVLLWHVRTTAWMLLRAFYRLSYALANAIILFHYRIGAWLTERILLRFPIALLVTAPGDIVGHIVQSVVLVTCVALGMSVTAGFVSLGVWWITGHSWLADPLNHLWLGLPLPVLLVVGTFGKWRYRRREAKGLAHV